MRAEPEPEPDEDVDAFAEVPIVTGPVQRIGQPAGSRLEIPE